MLKTNKTVKIGLFSAALTAAIAGIGLQFEGLVKTPYLDPVAIKTVCYGYTENSNLGFKIEDKTYTKAECADLLIAEFELIDIKLNKYLKVEVSDSRRLSLLDFAYNKGFPALLRSGIINDINQGNPVRGCTKMLNYVYAGTCKEGQRWCVLTPSGKWKFKFNGLVKRAEHEYKMCLQE
jgi:GH24 family phage-related lysozyme (muramidase)